jgi:hypothetical protein
MTTETSPISRRNFLYLSLVTAAAGVASGCRLFSLGNGSPLDQALAAIDLESAKYISRELANLDPNFKDKGYLANALVQFESASSGSANEGSSHLAQAIVSDFRSRRTVKISGWVLSLTEAQLIALKALSE